MKKFLFILLVPLFLFSASHHDWTYNQNIYEVNVRQYTESGIFDEFSEHLDRLQAMGVGILWFMPIHPIGEENRLGSLGSYYSVKDYFGINPEFGTMTDFKELVDEIHNRGMYVMMDWVANHTAWDNKLTITHPEWYSKDGNGNFISPPGTNWSDVIDLDYSQQGLREYMIDAMKFWIDEAKIDGFRCDAVNMVPMDFWSTAISELKARKPDLFMLAEGEGKHLEEAGFDMTYCWGLHAFGNGLLTDIINDSKNANDLAVFITNEAVTYSEDHYHMYFTSNHDENSWHGTVFENFGDAAGTFAALTMTLDGMPLIYSGQEAGLNKRLAFFDKDQIPWQDHPYEEIYTKLLHLKKSNPALWNGKSGSNINRISSTNNADVFAFVRENDEDKVLSIFNLSPNNQSPIFLTAEITGKYQNLFTGDTLTFQQGSNLTLTGWEYRVFYAIDNETKIENAANFPSEFSLSQNYPNPFNNETVIEYSLPENSRAELTIFNVAGKKVEVYTLENQEQGRHQIHYNATHLPAGIYFYQLKFDKYVDCKRMILLK